MLVTFRGFMQTYRTHTSNESMKSIESKNGAFGDRTHRTRKLLPKTWKKLEISICEMWKICFSTKIPQYISVAIRNPYTSGKLLSWEARICHQIWKISFCRQVSIDLLKFFLSEMTFRKCGNRWFFAKEWRYEIFEHCSEKLKLSAFEWYMGYWGVWQYPSCKTSLKLAKATKRTVGLFLFYQRYILYIYIYIYKPKPVSGRIASRPFCKSALRWGLNDFNIRIFLILHNRFWEK